LHGTSKLLLTNVLHKFILVVERPQKNCSKVLRSKDVLAPTGARTIALDPSFGSFTLSEAVSL
jgi:hypothetical protein